MELIFFTLDGIRGRYEPPLNRGNSGYRPQKRCFKAFGVAISEYDRYQSISLFLFIKRAPDVNIWRKER